MLFTKNFFIIGILLIAVSTSAQTLDTTKVDVVFERAEIEAYFPGGIAAWQQFLKNNLNPMVPIDNGAPAGRYVVYVQFIVDKNGKISDVVALTNHGYGMEQEVIRIIKKSGDWSPAIQNQRPVKAYRKQPVTFEVIDDDIDITTEVPYTLYTRTDNVLTIQVSKVKNEDVQLTLSEGTVTPAGDGKYIAKVNKPGRVIIGVYDSKKNKKVGDVSFEVLDKK